jgi:hypothetical protein
MRRSIALACAVAGAAAVVAVVWVGLQAWHARGELISASAAGSDVVSAVQAGDDTAAAAALERVQEHTRAARDAADGPVWRALEVVPWAGAQLAAVRTVADHVAAVSDDGLAPVLAAARSAAGGSIDTAALSAQRDDLAAAARVWADADSAVAGIDEGALVPPLAGAVSQARALLDGGAAVVDGVARAAVVLPGLLGSDGPRSVLVMLQNPAESRTGGGITGAFVELQVDQGAITLVRQADSTQFPYRDQPIGPVPASQTSLYGDVVGRFVQNATMTADFALSAQLASAWWAAAYGDRPDAVLAIDPLVLSALLEVHGPVALGDGTSLTADELPRRLLIDPYTTLDPEAQTAFLEDVTTRVFGALTADIRPVDWVRALAPAIADGRVSLWSADATEQAALSGSPVGGMAARVAAAGAAGFGVYLNDATGGKMDSYLSVSVDAGFASCPSVDGTTAVMRVTLSNTAPADARAWPQSMTGGGLFGTAVGDIGTLVTASAPPGAAFGGVTGEEGALLSANVVDDGRPSSAVRVNVSPGETETVELRFVLAARPADEPVIVHTPALNDVAVGGIADDACP